MAVSLAPSMLASPAAAKRRCAVPEITWLHDVDEACQLAGRERKLVLLDFFSPT
jgi:hypothetical protein